MCKPNLPTCEKYYMAKGREKGRSGKGGKGLPAVRSNQKISFKKSYNKKTNEQIMAQLKKDVNNMRMAEYEKAVKDLSAFAWHANPSAGQLRGGVTALERRKMHNTNLSLPEARKTPTPNRDAFARAIADSVAQGGVFSRLEKVLFTEEAYEQLTYTDTEIADFAYERLNYLLNEAETERSMQEIQALNKPVTLEEHNNMTQALLFLASDNEIWQTAVPEMASLNGLPRLFQVVTVNGVKFTVIDGHVVQIIDGVIVNIPLQKYRKREK